MGSIPAEDLSGSSEANTDSKASSIPAKFDDRILIIGAGIGGLAAAIALSRAGFKNITILEAKPDLNEFGASISITPFAVRILQSYGLEPTFRRYVIEPDTGEVRSGYDNQSLGSMVQNQADTHRICFGAPSWVIHRVDYQQLLAEGARNYGCKILFNCKVTAVSENPPTAWIQDSHAADKRGRPHVADFIVGAEGLRSVVRGEIVGKVGFRPSVEYSFRCSIPKDRMRKNPLLAPLLENQNSKFWFMQGKFVLAWVMPPDRDFDMVANVVDPDAQLPAEDGSWGVKVDKETMIAKFQDADPVVRALLAHVSQTIQWRTMEVEPIKTCQSGSGQMVLLGDAFHGMFPYNGCGGSSAIEDGAVLAECLTWAARNGRPHLDATHAYDDLRTPRVRRMQEQSRNGVGYVSASGEAWDRRNRLLAERTAARAKNFLKTEEERRATLPRPSMDGSWPSEEYLQWLHGYDAVQETRSYLAKSM